MTEASNQNDWQKSQAMLTISQTMDNLPGTEPSTKIVKLEKDLFQTQSELNAMQSALCSKEIQQNELSKKLKDTTHSHRIEIEEIKKECGKALDALKKEIISLKTVMEDYEKRDKVPQSHPSLKPREVLLFRSKHSALSTFYECPLEVNGIAYPDAETLYQCRKAEFVSRDKIAEGIRKVGSPVGAKRLANSKLRRYLTPKWHKAKKEVMAEIQQIKVDQCPEFQEALRSSGSKTLLHNMEYDGEWGIGEDASGGNLMGVILMELRDKLLSDKKETKNTNATHKSNENTPDTSKQGVIKPQPKSMIIYSDSMLRGSKKFIERPNLNAKLHCHPGKSAAEISRMVVADIDQLAQSPPTALVFHAGTNDLPTQSAEDIRETFDNLIINVQSKLPDTTLILSGIVYRQDIPQLNTKIDAINSGLSEIKRQKVVFVDNNSALKDSHKYLTNKGLHLKVSGIKIIAENLRAVSITGVVPDSGSLDYKRALAQAPPCRDTTKPNSKHTRRDQSKMSQSVSGGIAGDKPQQTASQSAAVATTPPQAQPQPTYGATGGATGEKPKLTHNQTVPDAHNPPQMQSQPTYSTTSQNVTARENRATELLSAETKRLAEVTETLRLQMAEVLAVLKADRRSSTAETIQDNYTPSFQLMRTHDQSNMAPATVTAQQSYLVAPHQQPMVISNQGMVQPHGGIPIPNDTRYSQPPLVAPQPVAGYASWMEQQPHLLPPAGDQQYIINPQRLVNTFRMHY